MLRRDVFDPHEDKSPALFKKINIVLHIHPTRIDLPNQSESKIAY